MSKRNRYRAFRKRNIRDRAAAHAEFEAKTTEEWTAMALAHNPKFDAETALAVGQTLRDFWLRFTAPSDGRVPFSDLRAETRPAS